MGIFLDVKKAFDSVNHENLSGKLSYARIRGTTNKLIWSYLTDKSKIVKIKDKCSQPLS